MRPKKYILYDLLAIYLLNQALLYCPSFVESATVGQTPDRAAVNAARTWTWDFQSKAPLPSIDPLRSRPAVRRTPSAPRRTLAAPPSTRSQRPRFVQRAPPGIDELSVPMEFIPPVRPPGASPIVPDIAPPGLESAEETVEEIKVVSPPPPPSLPMPPSQILPVPPPDIIQPYEKKRYSGYSYNKYNPEPSVPYVRTSHGEPPLPPSPPIVVEKTIVDPGPMPPAPPPKIVEMPAKPRHYGGYFG